MKLLGIYGFEDTTYSTSYWMASRITGSLIATTINNEQTWWSIKFGVKNVTSTGTSPQTYLIIRENNENYYDLEYGLRPVFILAHSVLISNGDGTITNPYTLEIDE